MLFSSLRELKVMLEIEPDDTSEDVRLSFWLAFACRLCERYLNYSVFRMERTEYYNGSGTQKLVLKTKPCYNVPQLQVWTNERGYFGETSGSFGINSGGFPQDRLLVYGQDYVLWMDDGDNPTVSNRAILIRITGLWNKTSRRQIGLLSPFVDESFGSIKVTYTAGYYAEELPPDMILAVVMTTARIRFMMPLGMPVNSDSYQGRSVNIVTQGKNWLTDDAKRLLFSYRGNRRF